MFAAALAYESMSLQKCTVHQIPPSFFPDTKACREQTSKPLGAPVLLADTGQCLFRWSSSVEHQEHREGPAVAGEPRAAPPACSGGPKSVPRSLGNPIKNTPARIPSSPSLCCAALLVFQSGICMLSYISCTGCIFKDPRCEMLLRAELSEADGTLGLVSAGSRQSGLAA